MLKFTKYSKITSCLLVVEQNYELLMKNYQYHLTSSTPFPEVNGISFHHGKGNRNHRYRRDRKNYRNQWECTQSFLKKMLHTIRSGTILR